MSRFKTVHADGKMISAQGELRILTETKGWQQKVEVWLLNDEVNNNNWQYLNLERHKHLFAETPLLVAYIGNRIGDGHNFEEVKNADGSVSASFIASTAERIVGYFKSENDIRIEVRDGKKWIVGTGYIWKWYAQELVAKLEKQGLQGMAVSIETLIDEMYYKGNTEVFTKYQILGCTILGDDVSPAVTGANIRALSAIGVSEVKKITMLKVASQNGKEQNPQNKKQGVKRTMKAKELEQHFPGFTVLAVEGNNVALLSEKGVPHLSTVQKDGDEIVCGVKTEVVANAVFGNGENAVNVSVDEIVEKLVSANNVLKDALEKKESERETVANSLKAMQVAEINRRKEAVKNAITTRLSEIKENTDADIADNECDDLLTDERIAEYAECEDKDGNFCGDEMARKDVDSRCMQKSLAASKAKQKSNFSWQNAGKRDNEAQSGLSKLIAKHTK